MWNEDTFKYIRQQCGGLREIDHKTKNFSNLPEARIQVNAESPLNPAYSSSKS